MHLSIFYQYYQDKYTRMCKICVSNLNIYKLYVYTLAKLHLTNSIIHANDISETPHRQLHLKIP